MYKFIQELPYKSTWQKDALGLIHKDAGARPVWMSALFMHLETPRAACRLPVFLFGGTAAVQT